jgi:ribosomal RNA-processing protein 12
MVERRMTRSDAEKSLKHLAGFASNLLAVLFNVYSQTLPHSRAYILQCINAYLSITPEKDLVETFDRVSKMLEQALPKPNQPPPKKQANQEPANKLPSTSHTLLDLIIALSVHLPRSTFGALFTMCSNILTNSAILRSDPQLIKKAYKLIPRLSTSPTGSEALKARSKELQDLMLSTSETTPVPARRDRILAIETLVSFMPLTDLHFIPSILSEVVLACKDSNERARTAGFDLLITLTNKISDPSNPPNTVIHNKYVPHMPDDSPDAPANLEEVFTMVSAGLAGVAPHMVAASVIALSRLLWEYHSQLTDKTKEELVDTVCMFLQSNNREIVRAVLGFVKVMIVVLPVPMLEPRMPAIVPGLMVWSKENKGRLRAKVKNILDRCLRRFDANKVESWVGGDDRKMIVNIRKRRDRARRNKKGDEAEDEDAEQATSEKKYDNEFDEAVYGSEDDDSEIEGGDDSDDGDGTMPGVSFKKSSSSSAKSRGNEQYIRQDDEDDEPLDLLDPRSMANISTRKLGRLRDNAAPSRRTKAKVNEDGKLVFGGADDNDNDVSMDDPTTAGENGGSSVNAYLDAVSGADAVKRGQKGRLKVKSGMQKKAKSDTQRREKDEMELDVEEARQVARRIMAGSGSPRSPRDDSRGDGGRKDPRQQRRGLGVEKGRGETQRQKFRGGSGVGKHGGFNKNKHGGRNVKFGGGRGGGRGGRR